MLRGNGKFFCAGGDVKGMAASVPRLASRCLFSRR
ncbi:hypothetical protein [Cryobacterium sp. Y62]